MKFHPVRTILVLAALIVTAQSASAKELVVDFTSPATGPTREFKVQGPWLLDWLVVGEPASYDAVDISLYNAETGAFEGDVLKAQNPGNGVRLFKESGRFYFQVNASMMNWHLKVYQLTADEAKQYKPKTETSVEQ